MYLSITIQICIVNWSLLQGVDVGFGRQTHRHTRASSPCYVQRVPCCRTGIHSTSIFCRGSTQAWVVSRVVEGGSDQVVKELGALEFAEEVVWKSPVDLW